MQINHYFPLDPDQLMLNVITVSLTYGCDRWP